jgi:hypothetical protein
VHRAALSAGACTLVEGAETRGQRTALSAGACAVDDPLQTGPVIRQGGGMTPERALDEYAARQYGVFSLDQARRAGISDDMAYRRVRAGAWVRLAPGVYALASAPPKWERQLAAAVLSRPEAVVGGSSAAYLHGFDGFRRGRPEIVVPAGSNTRSAIARVTRSTWFDELGIVVKTGFTATNEAETITNLAARMSMDDLEPLLDDRLTAGKVTVDDFEIIRRRSLGARVRGAARLFPLLDARAIDAWEPPGNQLERLLDRLVDHPEVPPATRQHPLHLAVASVVDLYIAAWRLILEADGRRWHTRRVDFERDRRRDNAAAARGLAVLRFTWRMLTRDFEECRRTLLETGAERARLLRSTVR